MTIFNSIGLYHGERSVSNHDLLNFAQTYTFSCKEQGIVCLFQHLKNLTAFNQQKDNGNVPKRMKTGL